MRRNLPGWRVSVLRGVPVVLQINQGTLYPALHRLEAAGLVVSEWRPSENNRRAKYYEITRSGRRKLVAEQEQWAAFADAVRLVMQSS